MLSVRPWLTNSSVLYSKSCDCKHQAATDVTLCLLYMWSCNLNFTFFHFNFCLNTNVEYQFWNYFKGKQHRWDFVIAQGSLIIRGKETVSLRKKRPSPAAILIVNLSNLWNKYARNCLGCCQQFQEEVQIKLTHVEW